MGEKERKGEVKEGRVSGGKRGEEAEGEVRDNICAKGNLSVGTVIQQLEHCKGQSP